MARDQTQQLLITLSVMYVTWFMRHIVGVDEMNGWTCISGRADCHSREQKLLYKAGCQCSRLSITLYEFSSRQSDWQRVLKSLGQRHWATIILKLRCCGLVKCVNWNQEAGGLTTSMLSDSVLNCYTLWVFGWLMQTVHIISSFKVSYAEFDDKELIRSGEAFNAYIMCNCLLNNLSWCCLFNVLRRTVPTEQNVGWNSINRAIICGTGAD